VDLPRERERDRERERETEIERNWVNSGAKQKQEKHRRCASCRLNSLVFLLTLTG